MLLRSRACAPRTCNGLQATFGNAAKASVSKSRPPARSSKSSAGGSLNAAERDWSSSSWLRIRLLRRRLTLLQALGGVALWCPSAASMSAAVKVWSSQHIESAAGPTTGSVSMRPINGSLWQKTAPRRPPRSAFASRKTCNSCSAASRRLADASSSFLVPENNQPLDKTSSIRPRAAASIVSTCRVSDCGLMDGRLLVASVRTRASASRAANCSSSEMLALWSRSEPRRSPRGAVSSDCRLRKPQQPNVEAMDLSRGDFMAAQLTQGGHGVVPLMLATATHTP
mmetsp:Transcript_36001/g.114452  ORF Transcript_36001/g.114452 Transcript_36001/m.114452 type:complete len:283 (-) Transcript_36001:68-916(-)